MTPSQICAVSLVAQMERCEDDAALVRLSDRLLAPPGKRAPARDRVDPGLLALTGPTGGNF